MPYKSGLGEGKRKRGETRGRVDEGATLRLRSVRVGRVRVTLTSLSASGASATPGIGALNDGKMLELKRETRGRVDEGATLRLRLVRVGRVRLQELVP